MKHLATIIAITGILSLLVLAACGGATTPTSERAATVEPVRPAESAPATVSESGGRSEGSESGEHGAGSESGGHSEGPGEGEESATQYGLVDTYDQVRAGARLVISYDLGSNTFAGTVENTTGATLPQVRVEVHLSNGVELGPTTPVDLAPGETADVTLEASVKPFETWSAHPEVGPSTAAGSESGERGERAATVEPVRPAESAPATVSESGGRSEGSESGEHGAGSESGGHSEGPGEGEESATQYGLVDTYDQVRAGARLVISYDLGSNTFAGTVENTTGATLPQVRVEVHLSNGVELGPTTPVDLAPGETADVTLEASVKPFETWSAHPEVGPSTAAGSESGERGEPATTVEPVRPAESAPATVSESGGRSEGSESGEHGAGSESGGHSEGPGEGEESATQYGLVDTYDQVRAGARLVISYDLGSNTFAGTVENTTGATLPQVRVEVHLSNGVELGPTTPVDLAPGETADVTLEASVKPFETWSAHPEVGPSTAAGSESGERGEPAATVEPVRPAESTPATGSESGEHSEGSEPGEHGAGSESGEH